MAEKPVVQDSPSLDALLARFDALEAENAALRGEVAQLQAQQPKFVKMARPEQRRKGGYVPPEELRAQAMKTLGRGQRAGGHRDILDDPTKLNDIPVQYHPIFETGDTVVLNPNAEIHGGEGRVWGQIAQADGFGEVLGRMGRSESWEWKYRVVVPGLTRPEGDGFYEHELLPA